MRIKVSPLKEVVGMLQRHASGGFFTFSRTYLAWSGRTKAFPPESAMPEDVKASVIHAGMAVC